MNSWYLSREGSDEGPFEESAIIEAVQSGNIDPNQAYLWREGMEGWQTIAQLGIAGAPAPAAQAAAAAPAQQATPSGGKLVFGGGNLQAAGARSVQMPVGQQAPATNPYTAPTSAPLAGAAGQAVNLPQSYPGLTRLGYFFSMVGVNLLFLAGSVLLGEEPSAAASFVLLGLVMIGSLLIAISRLRNLARHPALVLLFFVPLANIWLGFELLCSPPGYGQHKQMDTAGKTLTWVFIGLLILPLILFMFLFLAA